MSKSLAAIIGGAAGFVAFVLIVLGCFWFFFLHRKSSANRNSETGSSDPSAQEWNKGTMRQFTLEELGQATKHFSESNLIGEGRFGLVFKGLLRDGTVVAIKRRSSAARPEFVEEVHYLSEIRHRNLVSLLGYCQEYDQQMLVYEYLPNGSVSSHLYDTGLDPTTKLEFKYRLFIALGAAKGLSHLHGMAPPLVHKDFKTSNVLVDENFIAKVADVGLSRLLERIDEASSSRVTRGDVFLDPEVGDAGSFSESSDVYSFGVFLLELVTGRQAGSLKLSESVRSLYEWVESCVESNEYGSIVDPRLGPGYTKEGMGNLFRLILRCLSLNGGRRPAMEQVSTELDRILEEEMTLTTVMGEGTATVTLGSQLFTSST
ncbi:proline-rich receptor-like protein kinase PERK3 [Amborella trichopoda]|uniref:non-specific serine/threonine protein kinase n=1 Tax=Amborella trichopoda TaxID=13333 RepID=U5D685_AMBTC|nr:proline-rich receptor-like protein kinase PERK3 [Amborella trichopoda]ERN16937.1 hypothetical protein AMTR_s00057p00187090 [Amborella trichopoda]|eukprot:XP_020529801.1 proline-rich receptor-like protein kinase PERK3 [Amborella trichopoda]